MEEAERRINTQEASSSETKASMSSELETRMGGLATDVQGLRTALSEHTQQMAGLLDQSDAALKGIQEVGVSVAEAEKTLVRHAESLVSLQADNGKSAELLVGLQSDTVKLRDQAGGAGARLDALQGEVSAAEAATAGGLKEAAKRLDELEAAASR